MDLAYSNKQHYKSKEGKNRSANRNESDRKTSIHIRQCKRKFISTTVYYLFKLCSRVVVHLSYQMRLVPTFCRALATGANAQPKAPAGEVSSPPNNVPTSTFVTVQLLSVSAPFDIATRRTRTTKSKN